MQIEMLEGRRFLSAQADATGDGVVDSRDFDVVSINFGRHDAPLSKSQGDFNLDQCVNAVDFNILASAFGSHAMTDPTRQSIASDFSGDATQLTKTLALSQAVLAGSTVLIFIAAKKASGTGAPTTAVVDSAGRTYTQVAGSNNSAAGFTTRLFVAFCDVAASSFSVTVTADVACNFNMGIVEMAPPAGKAIFVDQSVSFSATSTSVSSLPFTLNYDEMMLVGGLSHTAASTIAITPGAGFSSISNSNGDATHLPLSIIKKVNADDQDAVSFSLASSAACRGVAASLYETDVTAATGAAASNYPADLRIDSRDATWVDGTTIPFIPIHGSGYEVAVNGAFYANGFNGKPKFSFTATGTTSGLTIASPGDYGSIFMTGLADSALFGANASGNPADGALYIATSSKNTTGKVGISGSSIAVTDGSTGTSMSAVPVVYGLTRTSSNTAILSVNGFDFAAVSLGAAPLAITALKLFAQYSSGSVTGNSTGDLYEFRGYLTPQNAAQRAAITSEMAWPMGEVLTERYAHLSFDNASNVMLLGQTTDGTAFDSYRKVSYTPVVGNCRDVDLWYDASTATYYAAHTTYNFTVKGDKFAIAKAKDLRLWAPHTLVDVSDVIDAATQNPWAPQFYPHGQTPTNILFHNGQASTKVYRKPITSLSAGTFGSSVRLTSASGSDAFVQPPSVVGNPSGKYRFWGGVTGYQEADALDGPYGSKTTIDATGASNEAPYVDVFNGEVRAYACGNLGTVYWTSTDNGATWSDSANPTVTTGNTIAGGAVYDAGQGALFDRRLVQTSLPTRRLPRRAPLSRLR
jgi:hypothetical protein